MSADTAAASGVIRVLIADDHAIVREGIRQVLSLDEGFQVVGEADGGYSAISLAESLVPDVIVLDLSMPDLSGLEAASRIRERLPDVSILVLSIHDHEEYVLRSMRAGTQGYLRKDCSPAELRNAVRVVFEGGSFLSAPVARRLGLILESGGTGASGPAAAESLTARERDVLMAIARGATNKEIAAELGISVRTVESHRESVMKKLNIRGAAGLTRFAIDSGLLASSEDFSPPGREQPPP